MNACVGNLTLLGVFVGLTYSPPVRNSSLQVAAPEAIFFSIDAAQSIAAAAESAAQVMGPLWASVNQPDGVLTTKRA